MATEADDHMAAGEDGHMAVKEDGHMAAEEDGHMAACSGANTDDMHRTFMAAEDRSSHGNISTTARGQANTTYVCLTCDVCFTRAYTCRQHQLKVSSTKLSPSLQHWSKQHSSGTCCRHMKPCISMHA